LEKFTKYTVFGIENGCIVFEINNSVYVYFRDLTEYEIYQILLYVNINNYRYEKEIQLFTFLKNRVNKALS
jgi:hypothetical protein